MASRETTDRTLKFLKDWAIPASVMLVAATGAWVRVESVLGDHNRRLEAVELDFRRAGECGSDGFLSPTAHSAHDQHIRHFFTEELGRTGWRRLLSEFGNNVRKE